MMKKVILTLCILIPFIISAEPNSKYVKAMQAAIEALFQSETLEDYTASANTFERIGLAEKNEWHPHYYLALSRILLSTQSFAQEDVDLYLDQAQSALDTATSRYAQPNSEIVSLQGFIYMLRIPVDAATRGPQYSGLAMQKFQKAVGLNPENPRALYLLANMQMGTAQFFGSGISEACETLDRSIQLFEHQQLSENSLDPVWGEEWAHNLKKRCEKE
jgi:hypothetical protein